MNAEENKMSTIEQVMEGVSNGGKWIANDVWLEIPHPEGRTLAWFNDNFTGQQRKSDASYAARACSTWPELVRALHVMVEQFNRSHEGEHPAVELAREQARAALAEALKEKLN